MCSKSVLNFWFTKTLSWLKIVYGVGLVCPTENMLEILFVGLMFGRYFFWGGGVGGYRVR